MSAARLASAKPAVVSVDSLGKRFKLYASPADRLKEWLTLGRACRHTEFWALRDITFEVRAGECLGIIGVNGAGKTTLLKILSRALYPTEGVFDVRGRVASLLDLGTGFQPELTGRQNIFQSAQLLGFPDRYVRDRLGAILDFAELGEFIDQPVKNYSSGMTARLGFAVATEVDADILIVDEALTVGDSRFQMKCMERIEEFRRRGMSILFVSHNLEQVRWMCSKALWIDNGVVREGHGHAVLLKLAEEGCVLPSAASESGIEAKIADRLPRDQNVTGIAARDFASADGRRR